MNIISWDVGLQNLSYCLINYFENTLSIIDYKNINISNKFCCFDNCKKISIYNIYFNVNIEKNYDNYYICEEHKNNFKNINILKLFCEKNYINNLIFIDNNCDYCKNKSYIKSLLNGKNYCENHIFNIIKIKKKIKKYDLNCVKMNLIKFLDSNNKLFNVDFVIIENQPALLNPIIKTIGNCLHDYYLIKKKNKTINIFLRSPKNKIFIELLNYTKFNEDYKLLLNEKIKSKKYLKMKKISINICESLFKIKNIFFYKYLLCFDKKDDLCDAFLLGLSFINDYFKINFTKLSINNLI